MSDLVNRTTTSIWQLPPTAGQIRMVSTALVRAQHEQFWAYYIIISRLSADKRLWPCILVNQFIIYKYCALHIFFLRAAISWVVRFSFVKCVTMFFAPICTAGYGCSSWNFTLIYFMGQCNTCSTRLQSHSRFMTCSVCSECYHLRCLPNIDASDSVYLDKDSLPWICVICSGSIFPFNQCDDDCDFLETISELWDIKPIASFSNFGDRTFLPYELNSDRTCNDPAGNARKPVLRMVTQMLVWG